MLKITIVLVLGVVAALGVATLVGARRWNGETEALRARLIDPRIAPSFRIVEFDALTPLPPPVGRYLRTVLRDGQPLITEVRIQHRGTFNLSETAVRWKPFTSDQVVVTGAPGFDWNGRIAFLPAIPIRVHDAYIQGEGILHASLAGVVTLADQRGTPELAAGELMRYLAESVWYPTVLLPGQGVTWAAVDGNAADATLRAGEIEVTLRFHFGNDGLVERVSTSARGRTVAGVIVPTPWEGRFWGYADRNGVAVPIEGEVAWLLPDGPKPYWRGTITAIAALPAG